MAEALYYIDWTRFYPSLWQHIPSFGYIFFTLKPRTSAFRLPYPEEKTGFSCYHCPLLLYIPPARSLLRFLHSKKKSDPGFLSSLSFSLKLCRQSNILLNLLEPYPVLQHPSYMKVTRIVHNTQISCYQRLVQLEHDFQISVFNTLANEPGSPPCLFPQPRFYRELLFCSPISPASSST